MAEEAKEAKRLLMASSTLLSQASQLLVRLRELDTITGNAVDSWQREYSQWMGAHYAYMFGPTTIAPATAPPVALEAPRRSVPPSVRLETRSTDLVKAMLLAREAGEDEVYAMLKEQLTPRKRPTAQGGLPGGPQVAVAAEDVICVCHHDLIDHDVDGACLFATCDCGEFEEADDQEAAQQSKLEEFGMLRDANASVQERVLRDPEGAAQGKHLGGSSMPALPGHDDDDGGDDDDDEDDEDDEEEEEDDDFDEEDDEED